MSKSRTPVLMCFQLVPLPPRRRRRERCRFEHRHGPIVQHTEGKAIPQCMSREDEKLSGGFSCSYCINEARYWSCVWLCEDFIYSINRKVLLEACLKKKKTTGSNFSAPLLYNII